MSNVEMQDTQQSIAVQLKQKEVQFQAALPPQVSPSKFIRVVLTAVQNNPRLEQTERRSFWNACMKAAADGLLPDNREAAFVIFRVKEGNSFIARTVYMRMYGGLLKLIRNSGELATIEAHVVYEKDEFACEFGDDSYIKHRPYFGDDRGEITLAYSIAKLKNGELSREVMTRAEIEKVREVSRAKDDGPWVDWFSEMCKKSVLRRHAKILPMSTDLNDDEELGGKDRAEQPAASVRQIGSVGDKLRALSAGDPAESLPDAARSDAAWAAPVDNVTEPEAAMSEAPPTDQVLVDQLHEQARQRAKKGKSSLLRFIGGLPKDHIAIVNQIGKELNEIAAQADTDARST